MTSIRIQVEWESLGEVRLDAGGALQFPLVEPLPAVYRLSLCEHDGVMNVYIGETYSLRQRLHKNYRRPPTGATTSIWVNAWLTDCVRMTKSVEVSRAKVTAVVDDQVWNLDLARKSDRVLVESAAIALARQSGAKIMNKPGVNDTLV